MDEEYIEEDGSEEMGETPSKPSFIEKKIAQNKRNIDNNEKALRATAAVLKDKGIPYASAIAAGVDTADKLSGGRTTRQLGKAMNTANKMPGARPMLGVNPQKLINKLGDSGVSDAVNNIANMKKSGNGAKPVTDGTKKSSLPSGKGTSKTSEKGEIKLKIPVQAKLYLLIILLPFILISLAIFLIFGINIEASAEGSASFAYGETCTQIKVENSGCDENGNNCTLIYDGEVELEDYVAGIVAAEVGNATNLEFYKLAAIVTRTYVFANIRENCTVQGNKKFRNYIDVNDSPNAAMIKQAVAETDKQIILRRDDLIHADYSHACVVGEKNGNYQIRYGSRHYTDKKIQEIPTSWDQNNQGFVGRLSYLYSITDSSNQDINTKSCPTNNDDNGLSQLGAYYLITAENYTYQSVLEYYYGPGVSVVTNEMRLSGSEGFINPTGRIYCSSPFGTRVHPVSKEVKHHSGLDIAISGGEPIYAANNGTVTLVRNNVTAINNCNYGYGNYIIIEHENGLSTLYAHIKYDTIPESIVVGKKVRKGQQIGSIGSTGCSTGNHLHYEVRENNVPIDPSKYLNLTEASGSCKK